jgi:hypothetical protein
MSNSEYGSIEVIGSEVIGGEVITCEVMRKLPLSNILKHPFLNFRNIL